MSKSTDILILSRASTIWPGARELIMKDSGRLLTISRNSLRDASTRLLEEGYDPMLSFVLIDEATAQSERRSILNALDTSPLPPDQLSVREAQLAEREKRADALQADALDKLRQIRALA